MNAYANKNTGKLLVAILAMAMIIAGCAVLFGNNVAAEGTSQEPYTLDSEGTVSVSGIDEPMSLRDALAQQKDGQTWTLQPGYYNVTGFSKETTDTYVSKLVITANNLTISGAGQGQTFIYAYANSAAQSPQPEYDLNQGDTIAILGNGVTVQNMTVQGMIQNDSGFEYNKAITVYGTNATIRNVTVSQFNAKLPTAEDNAVFANIESELSNNTYGGGIIVSNGFNGDGTDGTGSNSVVIENVTMENGLVSTSFTDNADIRLSNVTFNVTDSAGAAVWRNSDITEGTVDVSATSVTVNINGDTQDYFDDIVNQAVSGMTLNVTEEQNGTYSELNIAAGVTVNTSVDITADTVNLEGRLAGAGTVSGTTLNVTPGASYNSSNVDFDTTNGGTAYDDIRLSGTLISDVEGTVNQRVIVTDDLVINGKTITVNGEFIVEDGATVTLTNGGKITINSGATANISGEIIVEAANATNAQGILTVNGTANVNGTVSLEGAGSFVSDGIININGTFQVGDNATANVDGATIATGGELIVYGIVTGSVLNNGTITVDSEGIADATQKYITTDFKVQMGAGAIVDVINLYGYFNVSDSDLKYTDGGWTQDAKYDNTIQIMHVAGIVITENMEIAVDDDNNRYGNNSMVISGNATGAIKYANATQSAPSNVTINAGDNIIIDGTVSFNGVDLNVNGGKLTVSGELTVGGTTTNDGATNTSVADITISNGAVMTVEGTVTTTATTPVDNKGTLNAAHYQLGTQEPHVYTTLENALAAGATSITVTGEITVNADVSIPVGTTVNADDAILNIAESATVTVEAADRTSGYLTNNNGTINVEGTLEFQNLERSRVTPENIVSDTSSVNGDAASYTNIYNALENAVDGETVEITKAGSGDGANTVVLDRDVEVKTGVTLEVPAGKTLTVGKGATITVNGTLVVDSGVFDYETAEDKADNGAAVINGMLKSTGATDSYQEWIVGAYFSYDGSNVIAPLATAADLVNDIESSQINLYGDMDVSEVEFNYTGNGSITLIVNDGLTCSNITIGALTFQVTDKGSVTGTVSMTNGSLEFQDVSDFTLDDVVTDGVSQATITGNPTVIQVVPESGTDEDETGSVTVSGTVYSSAVFDEYLTVNVPENTTLITNSGSIENATVAGTLTAAATTTITNASVTGTMNTDNARINVTNLYAGVTIDKNKVLTVGSGDAVIGDGVNVTGVAYVAPGTTVGETITGMSKSTEYYIGEDLFVTAYASGSDDTTIGAVKAPAEHAEFKNWMNSEEADATSQAIGATGYTEVYAVIEYNIYDIDVSACPGATVYIDGKEWNDYVEGYSGTLYAYGAHTITVYVAPGYEGTANITINGQAVTSGTFELTGDTEIVVTGITAIDYSQIGSGSSGSDDGLGLTDILLIILVVLIVIMAIMVAMRLMRS